MATRLKERYEKEVLPNLIKEMGYRNRLQAPRLDKIVINIGLGEAIQNAKALDQAVEELSAFTGQKPVITRARKAIANFKLREGMPIGMKVTLRRERMYDFIDRLINVVLPRLREFRGVPRNAFDGRGNYTVGIKEQIIFPEVDFNKIDRIRGLQVSIATTARNDEEGKRLLELLGMPFSRS